MFHILRTGGFALCLFASSLGHLAFADEIVDNSSVCTIGNITFRLPRDLIIEPATSEGLVRWPVAAVWDQGSMLVLESNWNRETVQQQLDSKPQHIVRLVDQNGDGVFETRRIIADQLSFSAGLMLYEGSLYVTSPPAILKLSDVDGDGFFERRESWYDGGTLTYCANDLHGPFLGPDGWIYWTKGAFADQTFHTRTGKIVASSAAHLLRRHPDGGPVDILMSGGMDNPVDVAFLPNGDRIFCSTFLHHPGNGLRDGIAHAIYGSLFGKKHHPIESHISTGPLFDSIEEFGPAAPASVTLLTKPSVISFLGLTEVSPTDAPIIISSQFNFQRLVAHKIVPQGATYTTVSEEIVSADRIDFHPVDVLEDNDGSLVVLDTGGWYDLCCPSSGTPGQVAAGGIYRIRGNRTTTNTLNSSITSVASRIQSLWQHSRALVNEPDNREIVDAVLMALEDDEEQIRIAAANLVSLYRWPDARNQVIDMLADASPQVRRIAAECLGRMQGSDDSTIVALLQTYDANASDRVLQHSLLYALIEIDNEESMRRTLEMGTQRTRYAALKVLQQTDHFGPHDLANLIKLADTDSIEIQTLLAEILSSHADWFSNSAELLERFWASEHPADRMLLEKVLRSGWKVPVIEQYVQQWLDMWSSIDHQQKWLLVSVISNVKGGEIPDAWVGGISRVISHSGRESVELAKGLKEIKWNLPRDQQIVDAIIVTANSLEVNFEDKKSLIEVLPANKYVLDSDFIEQFTSELATGEIALDATRKSVLRKVSATPELAKVLVSRIDELPSSDIPLVIEMVLVLGDSRLERQMIDELARTTTLTIQDINEITSVLSKSEPTAETEWKEILDIGRAASRESAKTVDDWLEELPPGNATEGYQVFRSNKAQCSACHQIGYVGGRIGPELTRIGRSRTKRDLLEAIIFPNARLEQSYRSTRVLTTDGRIFNGLISESSADHIELIIGASERKIILNEEIESRSASDVSLMPSGLAKTLTKQEIADLIEFLKNAD